MLSACGHHSRATKLVSLAVLVSAIAAARCAGSAPRADHDVRTPAPSPDPQPGAPLKIDMDAIFPTGVGRDLVLTNCVNCHSFVRIVLMQRTREQWAIVKANMRPRVAGLDDHDVDTIFEYLEASFDDTHPEPALPRWLLETETW